ncbi:hypothetical protein J4477_03650 [Candidatus Pacearchaeota archaeon]|nr:hypothetical protein [Candidatus Pacearchaeota archaeon]
MVGTISHFKDLIEVVKFHGLREMIHYDICVTRNHYDGVFEDISFVKLVKEMVEDKNCEGDTVNFYSHEQNHQKKDRLAEKDYEILGNIEKRNIGFVKFKARQMQVIIIGYCSSEFRTEKNDPFDPLIQFRELEERLRNFQ